MDRRTAGCQGSPCATVADAVRAKFAWRILLCKLVQLFGWTPSVALSSSVADLTLEHADRQRQGGHDPKESGQATSTLPTASSTSNAAAQGPPNSLSPEEMVLDQTDMQDYNDNYMDEEGCCMNEPADLPKNAERADQPIETVRDDLQAGSDNTFIAAVCEMDQSVWVQPLEGAVV